MWTQQHGEGRFKIKDFSIKALTFDVFGTVVDWRGSIIREGERLGAELGVDVD